VSIRLQPEELGLVRADVRLDAGTVNISLHAEGDVTRDLLRQNLGQLRQQLADAGLTTGRFDVGSGSQQMDPRAGDGGSGSATAGLLNDDPAMDAVPVVSADQPVPTSNHTVLDMRL
jgi:flagellar hook-length control protein FliK